MKRLFAILAALTVAAPAGAFIVPPEPPPEPEEPAFNTTKVDLRYCFEQDKSGEMISKTYNRKCVEVGNQTNMLWSEPEKCDDFEGCVKVGLLMNNDFYGTAYFDDRFIGTVAVFKDKDSAITYFTEFTISCQGAIHDVALQGINWRVNFNTVTYQYDVKQLTRDVCNKAFNVDTQKIKRNWRYLAISASCNIKFDGDWEKREHCKQQYILRQERLQWK